ncbi:MAG: inositol 2-dehydrogenase [Gordonia sp. (in: high G+C Gram-positive bacteria)]|uniref:inositol 2-dehydrogenase n=1 Tax=Gordonia sp. (in: high G+C Gram-positive bacteria) TaxID=84139 RepID=UPI0039E2993D
MKRIGLLGCGRIGQVHAASVAASARAELAAVFDPFEESARAVAQAYGAAAHTSPEPILDDESIDAVIVASPTPTHIDLLTRAVQRGKGVLCEKPIDLDLARVDACLDELGELTDRVMLGFNRRFDPSFADVRARVATGEIGNLEQLTIISRDPAAPPAGYVETSGGLFRDMMIHDLDMARFFLGDVAEVTALGSNLISPEIAAAGDVDGAVVTLRSVDGRLATITNSRRCAYGYDQRLEAFGELGALEARNQHPTSVRFSGAQATESAPPIHHFFLDRYTPAYRAEFEAFVTALETSEKPSPGFGDGRAALVLADAAGESLRTGRTITIG